MKNNIHFFVFSVCSVVKQLLFFGTHQTGSRLLLTGIFHELG